jgi:hypothetical protein
MLEKTMKPTFLLFGDFYIMDVKYDAQTGLANELLICEPRNFLPGSSFWVNRADIIGLIEDGYHLELFPPEDLNTPRRWFVRVVNVGGKNYLRADREEIPADLLTHGR